MKKNKIKTIINLIILISIIILIPNKTKASEKKEGIENFPESYRPYLEELNKKYPNWKFIALYTGLDWNYAIANENIFGKNLVPLSYNDRWKNTKQGEYNVEVDAGWVDSSKQAVEYAMDPRNFLNYVRIFQFENLSQNENNSNIDTIEKILYGTEFNNRRVEYYDSAGNKITTSDKYSTLILNAAMTSKVSSYHLAARIKQEVGPFLSHASISGTVEGFKGLYNFYNIGATSSSEPMGAIKNGLQYAKDGRGASEATKKKYLIPWDTKAKAVTGGAIFIGESYINVGQNTIYLQKFDVNDDRGGILFTHQYMTNVLAPYSESKSTYNGYSGSNILNSELSFVIPIYENMPEYPTESPSIDPSSYTSDNTKVYANVETTLNIRSGPSTSYEVICTVNKNDKLTRISKGKQQGELWDRVELENGIVGYAFQSYLVEQPEIEVNEIKLSLDKNVINKNERIQLNVEVLPENAENKNVIYSSSDTSVAVIDEKGEILGVSSGKSLITVKSEKYNISNSIEIEVYTPVSDLELDIVDSILQIGDTIKINPKIYPEDANNKKVIYQSEKENVAKVDKNGIITAISEGETNIVVKTEENNIEKNIKIKVIEKITEEELSFGNLKVEGNIITGLDYLNNKVSDIKNQITSKYKIEITNKEDEIITDEDIVGTEYKLKIYDTSNNANNDNNENIGSSEKLILEYYFVLYGDVNGDGKINSIDLLVLQRHILEIEKIEGVAYKAGNINKNGNKPTSVDLLLIQRHILGLKIIEQK